MVAVIDYDAGNIRSVENAVRYLGRDTVLTKDPAVILAADHVILPGVGAFGDAMARIESYGLAPVIRETIARGIPFLGICLGLQLLFDESEESPGVKGLGILKGSVQRFPEVPGNLRSSSRGNQEISAADTTALKIPQIGWNDLHEVRGKLFRGVAEGSYVYFVHSYYLQAEDRSIVSARATYGTTFDASVESGNVFACQFHPEKSERIGMKILSNFLEVTTC